MPQFDPSSFTSQLFWLAICFGLIYITMGKVFLPRIRDILKERKHLIDQKMSSALQLQEQAMSIESMTKSLRDEAILQYKISVEKSIKNANTKREIDLQNMNNKISNMIKDSQNEISQFKINSENDRQKAVEKLTEEMDNKFLIKLN